MTTLLATSFLAQRGDWIEGAVVVGVVVLSMLGSAGKWIVQQIAEKRERDAQRREGMPIDPPRNTATMRGGDAERSNIPPNAAPMPPVLQRTRKAMTPGQPPVMDRVLEVLLEKAAGTELERRIRKVMPQPSAPPPPPAARTSQPQVRKQPVQRKSQAPKSTRPLTIAERELHREQTRRTEVELEAQRLNQREQRFTEDTDQRLGHVETHIAAHDVHDSMNSDAYEISLALDDSEGVRRAIILSEVLAPPVALR